MVWGVLSGARIILFDGAYALIGIGIAGLSLRIAQAVAAGPTRRFPFGRDALTPLRVVGQGVALAATLFYAGADAVAVIREGGTPVAPGNVAAYGAVTGVISLVAAWWLRRSAPGSDLVGRRGPAAACRRDPERRDGGRSAHRLRSCRDLPGLGPADYVDPVLVLVVCAVLVPTPLRSLGSGTVELLEASRRPRSATLCARPSRRPASVGQDEPIVRAEQTRPEALRRGLLRRRAGRVGRQRGGRGPSRGRRRSRPSGVGRLGLRGARRPNGRSCSDLPGRPPSFPRHGRCRPVRELRRATSARTSGATCVPSSSIAVITAP